MPLFRTQSAAKQSSLAPHDSKARLRDVTTRRRSMAKPCTPHLHCAACAALQASDRQCWGSRGPPLAFSWGFKGAILSRERMAPLVLRRARRIFPPRSARKATAPPRERKKEAALSGCPSRALAGASAVQCAALRFNPPPARRRSPRRSSAGRAYHSLRSSPSRRRRPARR